jgi:hypothetical protein
MTLEEARTLVRLGGGRLLPPVGSVVDVHQFVGEGETTKVGSDGLILAVKKVWPGSRAFRATLRYGTITEDFPLLPDDQGRPRFILLPVQLPDPCPLPEEWPRWSR